jgi:hypothetical protein
MGELGTEKTSRLYSKVRRAVKRKSNPLAPSTMRIPKYDHYSNLYYLLTF